VSGLCWSGRNTVKLGLRGSFAGRDAIIDSVPDAGDSQAFAYKKELKVVAFVMVSAKMLEP
jgi:hypothetical protein